MSALPLNPLAPLDLKGTILNWGKRTYIMGILNLTPDSFSGDGLLSSKHNLVDIALKRAEQMLAEGADILDIGGESTRPGAQAISQQEEIDRTALTIEAITKRFDTVISIDTYKATVAREAIKYGAKIVNDVWALQADSAMSSVVAESGASLILMHNSSDPNKIEVHSKIGASYKGEIKTDIISHIKQHLLARVAVAISAGIERNRIILDPGFGFGKTLQQNLEILGRFNELTDLGFPLLSGPSRKSFVGQAINLAPEERLEGTLAAITLSINSGANIVRVHDVQAAVRAAQLTDKVMQSKTPSLGL